MASLLAIPKETFMKHRKTLWKSYVLMLCLSAGYMLRHGQVNFQPRKADASVVPAGKSVVSYAKLPLSFEANQGQAVNPAQFFRLYKFWRPASFQLASSVKFAFICP